MANEKKKQNRLGDGIELKSWTTAISIKWNYMKTSVQYIQIIAGKRDFLFISIIQLAAEGTFRSKKSSFIYKRALLFPPLVDK